MTNEKTVEALLLFCDAVDNATATLRNELKKISSETPQPKSKITIPEDRFSKLTWRDENGQKLGLYQIALIQDNDEQAWRQCYNILQTNKATIAERFHEESYQHSYWLYSKMDYKIFRQPLKETQ